MSTQMDTCYECKNTFDEYDLKECKPCAFFVCLNCIISCDLNKEYADSINSDLFFYQNDQDFDGPNTCGEDGSVSHKGCRYYQLEVCGCEWNTLYRGIRGGSSCEYTFCNNHREGTEVSDPLPNANVIEWCMDCDQARCDGCSIPVCLSCGYSTCIDRGCGGYCDSCDAEQLAKGTGPVGGEGWCADCIMKCWDEDCSRSFCEEHESNIQICKTCGRYSCFDHGEHECSVK